MLTMFNGAPAAEKCDLHTRGIWLLEWLCTCVVKKLWITALPLSLIRIESLGETCVWFTPLMTDLSPDTTGCLNVSQPYCNFPSYKYCRCPWALVVVRRPLVLTYIPVRFLWQPLYVSGTLLWTNPTAIGYRPGLSYLWECTLTRPPLFFSYG